MLWPRGVAGSGDSGHGHACHYGRRRSGGGHDGGVYHCSRRGGRGFDGGGNRWRQHRKFPLFDQGGYTGPGGVKQAAGIVHKGEVVFSQRMSPATAARQLSKPCARVCPVTPRAAWSGGR